jgi:magnesium transporter
MNASVSIEDVKALIEQGKLEILKTRLSELQPTDIAELISAVEEEDQITIFNVLPTDLTAESFDYFDLNTQKRLIAVFSPEQLADILNRMSPDDRTTLFEEFPSPEITRLLILLNPQERKVALNLLGFPEYSIGRLMTPDYIAVKKHWTVRLVLDFIRRNGKGSETLNVIYVVDDNGYLIDDIRVQEFLLAQPEKFVSDLMDFKFTSLKALDDQEEAVNIFKKLNRVAMPVVDSIGVLVGIVTVDDVLDVVQEENTEDIQKLGAVEALQEPYLEVPVFTMFRKRGSWLVILFLSEMLTATAMGFFQDEIAKAVVLALFVPLIISSGGNSGSQAATLIIRAMALGEVTIYDWWKVMRREIIAGILLGGTLAIIGFLRVSVWSIFSNIYGPHWFLVALTVSFSLIGVVLWGTLSGSMLPLFLRRIGLDPATSSAPFVATLVDVTGLVIYFSIALALLRGTML